MDREPAAVENADEFVSLRLRGHARLGGRDRSRWLLIAMILAPMGEGGRADKRGS